MAEGDKIVIKLELDAKDLELALEKSKKKINAFNHVLMGASSKAFDIFAQGISTAVKGLAEFGKQSVIVGAQFENTIVKLGAISGKVGEEIAPLEEQARLLGETTLFTATQAAEGMVALARAGLTTTQTINASSAALEFAGANAASMNLSTTLLAATMKQFSINAADSGRIVDTFTKSVQTSLFDVESLSVAMRYGGSVGASLGISLEETVGTLAQFRDLGLEGSMAGTRFRKMMLSLSAPTKKARSALASYGIALDEVNPSIVGVEQALKRLGDANLDAPRLESIVGKIAAADTAKIAKGISDTAKASEDGKSSLASYIETLEEARGSTSKTYDAMLNNTFAQYQILLSTVQELQLTIFDFFSAPISGGSSQQVDLLTEGLMVLQEVVRDVSIIFRNLDHEIGVLLVQSFNDASGGIDGLKNSTESFAAQFVSLSITTLEVGKEFASLLPTLIKIGSTLATFFAASKVITFTASIAQATAALATMVTGGGAVAAAIGAVGTALTGPIGLTVAIGATVVAMLGFGTAMDTAAQRAAILESRIKSVKKAQESLKAQTDATAQTIVADQNKIINGIMEQIKSEGILDNALKSRLRSLRNLTVEQAAAEIEAGRAFKAQIDGEEALIDFATATQLASTGIEKYSDLLKQAKTRNIENQKSIRSAKTEIEILEKAYQNIVTIDDTLGSGIQGKQFGDFQRRLSELVEAAENASANIGTTIADIELNQQIPLSRLQRLGDIGGFFDDEQVISYQRTIQALGNYLAEAGEIVSATDKRFSKFADNMANAERDFRSDALVDQVEEIAPPIYRAGEAADELAKKLDRLVDKQYDIFIKVREERLISEGKAKSSSRRQIQVDDVSDRLGEMLSDYNMDQAQANQLVLDFIGYLDDVQQLTLNDFAKGVDETAASLEKTRKSLEQTEFDRLTDEIIKHRADINKDYESSLSDLEATHQKSLDARIATEKMALKEIAERKIKEAQDAQKLFEQTGGNNLVAEIQIGNLREKLQRENQEKIDKLVLNAAKELEDKKAKLKGDKEKQINNKVQELSIDYNEAIKNLAEKYAEDQKRIERAKLSEFERLNLDLQDTLEKIGEANIAFEDGKNKAITLSNNTTNELLIQAQKQLAEERLGITSDNLEKELDLRQAASELSIKELKISGEKGAIQSLVNISKRAENLKKYYFEANDLELDYSKEILEQRQELNNRLLVLNSQLSQSESEEDRERIKAVIEYNRKVLALEKQLEKDLESIRDAPLEAKLRSEFIRQFNLDIDNLKSEIESLPAIDDIFTIGDTKIFKVLDGIFKGILKIGKGNKKVFSSIGFIFGETIGKSTQSALKTAFGKTFGALGKFISKGFTKIGATVVGPKLLAIFGAAGIVAKITLDGLIAIGKVAFKVFEGIAKGIKQSLDFLFGGVDFNIFSMIQGAANAVVEDADKAAERLKELQDQLDAGEITQEEFDEARSKGVGDPQSDQAASAFVTDLVDRAMIFMDALASAAPIVFDKFSELLPGLVNKIVETVPRLINSFISGLPTVLGAISRGLSTVLQNALNTVAEGFPTFISNLVDTLIRNIPSVLSALLNGLKSVVMSLISSLPSIVELLSSLAPALITTVLGAIEFLISKIPTIISELAKGVPSILTVLLKSAGKVYEAIAGAVPGLIDILISQGPLISKAFYEGIFSILTSQATGIVKIFTAVLAKAPEILDAALRTVRFFITAFIRALPGLIAALSELLPDLIASLIRLIPNLVIALVVGLAANITKIVRIFITEIIFNIDKIVVSLVGGLVVGLANLASEFGNQIGEAIKNSLRVFKNVFSNDMITADSEGEQNLERSSSRFGDALREIFTGGDAETETYGDTPNAIKAGTEGLFARFAAGDYVIAAQEPQNVLQQALDLFSSQASSSMQGAISQAITPLVMQEQSPVAAMGGMSDVNISILAEGKLLDQIQVTAMEEGNAPRMKRKFRQASGVKAGFSRGRFNAFSK